MRKMRGFTLIELLIVVAIIAILAAIAVPNFLEAQTRAKISRAKADMRTLATAIESYAVDYSSYPACGVGLRGMNRNLIDEEENSDVANFNAVQADDSPSWYRHTFIAGPHDDNNDGDYNDGSDVDVNDGAALISTPVAYIASLPSDPFSQISGMNFGYVEGANKSWIMWTTGPDMNLKWDTDGPQVAQLDNTENGDSMAVLGPDSSIGVSIQAGTLDYEFLRVVQVEGINLMGASEWSEVDAAIDGNSAGWCYEDDQDFIGPGAWHKANLEQVGASDDPLVTDGSLNGTHDVPWGPAVTSFALLEEMTYDPTNGTNSPGEIYRTSD